MKIKFNSDNLPLNKPLKFYHMTVTIRCVFSEDNRLYPQLFLDKALYSLQKMLKHGRVDISEEIDVNRTDRSKNVCFVIIGIFQIKTLIMDHIFVMVAMIYCKDQQILKILLLFILKKSEYRIYFQHMSKHEAKKLMKKFDLIDKTGSINCND